MITEIDWSFGAYLIPALLVFLLVLVRWRHDRRHQYDVVVVLPPGWTTSRPCRFRIEKVQGRKAVRIYELGEQLQDIYKGPSATVWAGEDCTLQDCTFQVSEPGIFDPWDALTDGDRLLVQLMEGETIWTVAKLHSTSRSGRMAREE